MNFEQINKLIQESLIHVSRFDQLILKRRPKEECINHRLALYMELLFGKIVNDDMLYHVDIEYNRNLEEQSKDVPNENQTEYIKIRPDIIIHKRQDNRDNLLAIEAKYGYLTRHDHLKLRRLLESNLNYRYSVGISYLPSKPYFKYSIYTLDNGNVQIGSCTINKEGY